ncbi:MAG TPA: hypothetical protein VMS56_10395 [Thermoanaerobaculia bacterium]|nr:hypothetical protein [Thermoanaerobaculia bacterium]
MRSDRGVVYGAVAVLLFVGALEALAAKGAARAKRSKRSAPRAVVFTVPEHDPEYPLTVRERALAEELATLWTRDAGRLVHVLSRAAAEGGSDRLTLLLAIAHAETNGRILLVSEAGAVGLAQATPVAYIAEGFTGPLHVTDDYLRGSRAYIMKKPLGDVARIASMLLEAGPDERIGGKAAEMLADAFRYRREGVDELLLLERWGDEAWLEAIRRDEQRNLRMLTDLEAVLGRGAPRPELEEIHERARSGYRSEIELQRTSWRRYQRDLLARRDAVLRARFGGDPEAIAKSRAYEAGVVLASELDERFSPPAMARFLVQHVDTKLGQARALGAPDESLERLTAALYNGGGHNVKRMRSGLIVSLPETERYSAKVPATRMRLDRAAASIRSSESVGGR